jgi:hypothetical protein
MTDSHFKKISAKDIKRADPNKPIAPNFNSPPPKAEDGVFPVRCNKEKRRNLYRMYWNLRQRADRINVTLPFINADDFIDFGLQSGYKNGQRIKRSKDFNYYDRKNIVFVDVVEPHSGRKNKSYQAKQKKLKEKNAVKPKKKVNIEIPDSFPEE